MKTIAELLAWHKSESLLCHVLNCSRAYLYTWPQKELKAEEIQEYVALVARLKAGEPLAYILGEQAFWSHDFLVNSHTLIPRPETEILIEKLLLILPPTPLNIADVGTGSGIIACTLALERPQWQMFATDISVEALAVAKINAQRLNVNINFLQANFLDPVIASAAKQSKNESENLDCFAALAMTRGLDAIISNPPYIAKNDPHLADLRYEPQNALVSGETGLEAFEKIIEQSEHYLKPNGLLAFEHGFDQGPALRNLLKHFKEVVTYPDLSGHERVTMGRKNG